MNALPHTMAAALVAALLLMTSVLRAQEMLPLLDEEGEATEEVLQALLAPGDFADRRFAHMSEGEEAQFAIDSSLGASEPFAQLAPERLEWPVVAGLKVVVNDESLKLRPVQPGLSDDDLDRGFAVRWVLQAMGQRFSPSPVFEMRVAGAQVISTEDGSTIMEWSEPPPKKQCRENSEDAEPNCVIPGLGKEARAIALSPDGESLAVAMGGLKPRVEVYDATGEPRLTWKSYFPADSGGVVEIAFSADGRWVVALSGKGRMHRYDAATGGMHMSIPSRGRSARSLPPGHVMAVAGESGEVTLWYLADGTIAWRLPPRRLRGPVDRIAPSGDGRRFATLEYDQKQTVVRVWETNRKAMLTQVEVDPYAVVDIALDRDGGRLFIAHEKKGLMMARVDKSSSGPTQFGGEVGAGCTGALQWIEGEEVLSCAQENGVAKLGSAGELVERLDTGIVAGDWIVTAASGGGRIAAIGEGHLLIWWREK